MASAFEKIGQHFQCPICKDRFQDPKTLDCLHSFCLRCLQNYTSMSCQESSLIPCPLCRCKTQIPIETGVGGLKTNFHLVSLMEELTVQEKLVCSDGEKLVCDICEGGKEATHRCVDCAQNICFICGQRHPRCEATSNHTVLTWDEIREGKLQPSKKQHPKCATHKGEVARFFCTTCEVLICRDCTVLDHPKPQHVYIDGNQAAAKYKQSLTELYFPLEEKLKQMERSRAHVSSIQSKFNAAVERITGDVRDKAEKLRHEITKQENDIVEEINRIKEEQKQKADYIETTRYLLEERIQYSLETTREMASTASDSDFLSLYSTISKDMQMLSRQNAPGVDSRLPYLRFDQKQGVGDINLGELVTAAGKWKLCHQIYKEENGLEKFDGACAVAVLTHNEIYVADFNNHRVQILNVDENPKRQIPVNGRPARIAVLQPGNRLVAVSSNADNVQVFNQDYSLAFEFPTVAPDEVGITHKVAIKGVAVRPNGNILVGDVSRKVLTEHSPTDGALLRTIPVKIAPDKLAVSEDCTQQLCDHRLVIGGWKEAEVLVCDCDGATLFTIKPTIEGQPVHHVGCVCWDGSDIYIGVGNKVVGTDHIHHYDTQGRFLACIAQGLYNPLGITMTQGGKLAVADWKSVKIYRRLES